MGSHCQPVNIHSRNMQTPCRKRIDHRQTRGRGDWKHCTDYAAVCC